ncbi:MAG: hypothetical protein WC878_00240 [Candidatus Paceibacterota bacterium]
MKQFLGYFRRLSRDARFFLAASLFITATVIFVYAAAQEILRSGANDPQIQMAKDASFLLKNSTPMGPIIPDTAVEISQSLAPFLQIYDNKGGLLDSNVLLRGKNIAIPKGALEYAKERGENRLTWTPERGVRIAAVIFHYGGKNPGFVVAGRSLGETENRIGRLGALCVFAWAAMMCLLGAFYYFLAKDAE